jgi:hypothetical protein
MKGWNYYDGVCNCDDDWDAASPNRASEETSVDVEETMVISWFVKLV